MTDDNTPDDERIEVVTPQFDREDGITPGDPPSTHEEMNQLLEATEAELKELGLRKWDDESGLWLLPHDWYRDIPDNFPLLDITGEASTRGDLPAVPDKRFGCLSIGIVPDFEADDP